ncbi:CD225/dispanin family protein [Streptomyces sp. NPDC058000]|uniref:CD225/dispanin family protein n=1 Tax=Streptomyces sp. NPDC058000 TaxID=3346299 RepID=UPI0036F042FA
MSAPGPSSGDRSNSPDPPPRRHYPPPTVPPVYHRPPTRDTRAPRITQGPKPPTYWWLSIITFLFFWLLFGAVGMYYSAQVSTRWGYGDAVRARQASKSALIVNLVGIGIGLAVWIALIALGNSGGGGSSPH